MPVDLKLDSWDARRESERVDRLVDRTVDELLVALRDGRHVGTKALRVVFRVRVSDDPEDAFALDWAAGRLNVVRVPSSRHRGEEVWHLPASSRVGRERREPL